jgi:hypothetical protein
MRRGASALEGLGARVREEHLRKASRTSRSASKLAGSLWNRLLVCIRRSACFFTAATIFLSP